MTAGRWPSGATPPECSYIAPLLGVILGEGTQYANPSDAVWCLPACCHRPCRRAAEQRDELTPFHVDGPRLARDNFACRTEVACSHVSGLFTQSGWTAGPDGVREPSPHHSNGIDVPMKRQASLGCVGSTDCAITRHYSLASSRAGAVAY